MSYGKTRPATDEERKSLIAAYRKEMGLSEEEVSDDICAAAMIVENYMTGCPGYVGPVGILLWDGAPGYLDSFTKDIVGRTPDGYPIHDKEWKFATERDGMPRPSNTCKGDCNCPDCRV